MLFSVAPDGALGLRPALNPYMVVRDKSYTEYTQPALRIRCKWMPCIWRVSSSFNVKYNIKYEYEWSLMADWMAKTFSSPIHSILIFCGKLQFPPLGSSQS